MTIVNIFKFVFPTLVVSIAVVLLCFYLHAKKKRAVYDVTMATVQEDSGASIQAISLAGQEVVERHYDRVPPRYSTIDLPPPYSLFDPKLTSVWPGGPPPAYEMYPITLPLAPHHWRTPSRPPSPSTSTHVHPPAHRASFS